MQRVRCAPPDPTLPKPWRGLIDCANNNLYFWNPETKVTTYERPTADPQPDMDNRIDDGNNSGDRSHQIQCSVDVGGCGENINNGDPSHQVKRKDTSESRTLKEKVSKKQKTTSPPLAIYAAKGHVEEPTIKPTEVSHSVDKEQEESNEINKTDQLAKETQKGRREKGGRGQQLMSVDDGLKCIDEEMIDGLMKQKTRSPLSAVDAAECHIEKSIMKTTKVSHLVGKEQPEYYKVYKSYQLAEEAPEMSKVEGEVPQSACINGAEQPQVNRSETFELNVISSTNLVAKETGTCHLEELAIMITDPYQELLSVADGPKRIGEYMIDGDGLVDQDGRSIKDNMLNDNVDCLMIDATQIETKLEKQPINRSSAPPIDKVEEDLALTESIDRLAGVTDQLVGVVEAMRYVIKYSISARETEAQLRLENKELNKKIAELEEKLDETMVGNQLARCQFSGSTIAGSKTDED